MSDRAPFTILCVDDVADNRDSTAMVLRLAGCHVLTAGSGTQALTLVRHADLVLLDVRLPDVSGFEVTRRIKADPETALILVVLVSGVFTSSEHKAEGLEGGGDAYLTKPVDPRELLGQVKALQRVREAELRAREAAGRADDERRLLRLQIERLPIGLVSTAADLTLIDWNPAAERIFGYSREEALGKSCFDLLVPPTLRPVVEDVLRRLFAGDTTAHSVNENQTKDGQTITCEWYNTPLLTPAGDVRAILSTVIDVTERVQGERALRESEERFRQAQKMEAVGRLAGGVAHDFNNLLTVINGYCSVLLAQTPESNPACPMLNEILKAGERAASLTGQLLAFSRKQVLQPKEVDLNVLIPDLQKMLRRLIGEDVEFVATTSPGLPQVKADPGQLGQALINLVVNARDAMPYGGRITIETQGVTLDEEYATRSPEVRPGHYVLVAVSDTGTGMDPETQEHISEPFFTTKEVGKGTGLGLAMVYGFVKASGGHVQVYSEVGIGTMFRLYFPALEGLVPKAAEPELAAAVLPRGSETVLVAEDEAGVRALIEHILRHLGYHVLTAANGPEALRVAAEHLRKIDLLVTDLVMPGGMGGQQVAEAVRAVHGEAKVLFVSGYTDNAVIRHGILEAGTNFLQKQYTAAGLARKVREALDVGT